MPPVLTFGEIQVPSDKLAEICQRYGVAELALFGSALRSEMRPDSDVDLLVEFQPNARIGILRFESLAEDIEALIGRKVDLVTKRGLKPWVRPQVLRNTRILYAA